MASYQEKAAILFGSLAQSVCKTIVSERPDLFLSVNEEQAFSAIVSYLRLHADELEVTPERVYGIYVWALGCLLHTRKITVATFGLSKRGKEQLDELTAQFRPAPAEDPKITEYRQFNAGADATEYRLRLSADEGFRAWANATN